MQRSRGSLPSHTVSPSSDRRQVDAAASERGPDVHSAAPGASVGHLQALMAAGGNLGMVQLSGGGGGDVREAAAGGVRGGGGRLPHYEAIQRSFGGHDVSGVGAHVGGSAAAACDSIGAQAYATGDQVAFREAPSLHTAAHEAAHVVQQRDGVQLQGGVGQVGDRYERHADAVADLVVQGKSAEGLLGEVKGASGGGKEEPVQRKASASMSVTYGEGHNMAITGSLSYATPRALIILFPFPVRPAVGDAFGAYLGLQGSISANLAANVGQTDAGLYLGGGLSGKARFDVVLAGGLSLSGDASDQSFEVFGGLSQAVEFGAAIDSLDRFKWGFKVKGALNVGFKAGPIKIQKTLGSLDLVEGEGSGWLTGLGRRPPTARGAALETGRPIQRQADDEGALPDVGLELEDPEIRPTGDTQWIADKLEGLVEEVSAIIAGLDEAAYDSIAAMGALGGFEDPAALRERINREVGEMSESHAEATRIRQEWLAKGAHYTSANNIAACAYNSDAAARDPSGPGFSGAMFRRVELELETEGLIQRARAGGEEARARLFEAGVSRSETDFIVQLVESAHKFPGYYVGWSVDGNVPADTDASARAQHLVREADEAVESAAQRAIAGTRIERERLDRLNAELADTARVEG